MIFAKKSIHVGLTAEAMPTVQYNLLTTSLEICISCGLGYIKLCVFCQRLVNTSSLSDPPAPEAMVIELVHIFTIEV